jgi:threonine dehydratase
MARSLPSPEFVKTAYDLIQGKITRTPLLTSSRLSTLASALQLTSNNGASETAPLISLYFKCENYQKTGSFKYRGVMHSLARLSAGELGRGLVATSSGERDDLPLSELHSQNETQGTMPQHWQVLRRLCLKS